MILSSRDNRLTVTDRERNATSITLTCYLFAATWGFFWFARGGLWGFTLLGLPGLLLFLIPALEPLLRSAEMHFDRSSRTIGARSRFIVRRATHQFPFSEFSRIEIKERRTKSKSRPNHPTFSVYLKRSENADQNTPAVLPLGWTKDESHAWAVVQSVCEVTGIPIPRDVKHDGPNRRGPKRRRRTKA